MQPVVLSQRIPLTKEESQTLLAGYQEHFVDRPFQITHPHVAGLYRKTFGFDVTIPTGDKLGQWASFYLERQESLDGSQHHWDYNWMAFLDDPDVEDGFPDAEGKGEFLYQVSDHTMTFKIEGTGQRQDGEKPFTLEVVFELVE